MKKKMIETRVEQDERLARELATVGTQRPGRTLPIGAQWTGRDNPGGAAAKRRLRQMKKDVSRRA